MYDQITIIKVLQRGGLVYMMYINIPEIENRKLSEKEQKLFVVNVIDYNDEYHLIDDSFEETNEGLIELQEELRNIITDVKNLKRKYRKLGEYRKAIKLYKHYMNLLYIKYGQCRNMKINKQIFTIKHADNFVKDYVPQKPKLITKHLRKAFKAGARGDDEPYQLTPDVKEIVDRYRDSCRKRSEEFDRREAMLREELGDEEYEECFVDHVNWDYTEEITSTKKGKKKYDKEMKKIFKKMAKQNGEKYYDKNATDEEIFGMATASSFKRMDFLYGSDYKKSVFKKSKSKKKRHSIKDYMRADWKEFNGIRDEDDDFEIWKQNIGMSYNSRYDDTDTERLRDMYMYDILINLGWSNAKAKQILGISKSDAKKVDRKYKKKKDSNGRRLYEDDVVIEFGAPTGSSHKAKLYYEDDDFDVVYPGDFPDEIIKNAYDELYAESEE